MISQTLAPNAINLSPEDCLVSQSGSRAACSSSARILVPVIHSLSSSVKFDQHFSLIFIPTGPKEHNRFYKSISYVDLDLSSLSLSHCPALHVAHLFTAAIDFLTSPPPNSLHSYPTLHLKCNLPNVPARLLPASNDFPIILLRVFLGWSYIMDEIDLLSN